MDFLFGTSGHSPDRRAGGRVEQIQMISRSSMLILDYRLSRFENRHVPNVH